MHQNRLQTIQVEAPPELVMGPVADVSTWSTFMPAVRSARRLNGNDEIETIEVEAEAGEETRTWRSSRRINAPARTITFTQIDPRPPFESMEGCWTFYPQHAHTIVAIEHSYKLINATDVDRVEAVIASNVTRDLAGLKKHAEDTLKPQSCPPSAVITGGSRGIGLAIATHFAIHGYDVLLGARNEAQLQHAVRKISAIAPSNEAHARVLDVRSDDSVEAFFEWTWNLSIPPTILVNNAGVGGGGHTTQLSSDVWDEIINTNLNGLYRCLVCFVRRMQQQNCNWGRVINVASTGGKQGVVNAAAYTASKHGVVGLTKSVGLELASSGITVNAVCPGFVETDLAVGARGRYAKILDIDAEEVRRRIVSRVPIGRYIEPNEVAEAAMYFASRQSDGVTAQTLNVCGGLGNY